MKSNPKSVIQIECFFLSKTKKKKKKIEVKIKLQTLSYFCMFMALGLPSLVMLTPQQLEEVRLSVPATEEFSSSLWYVWCPSAVMEA